MTFRNLSEAQSKVFEQIAIGNDASHHTRTIDSLLKKGLVEKYSQSYDDHIGHTYIFRYKVPVRIHIEWCDFCASVGKS